MEGLDDSVICVLLYRSAALEKCSTDKPGRRGEIARKSKKSGASSDSLHVEAPELPFGDFAGIEIDVVVEIGKMPVQRRRVGENAQLIFVENAFLVYYLKYNLTSALLCESPVYCGCARVDRVYLDTAHGFLYFIHCGTCPEDI